MVLNFNEIKQVKEIVREEINVATNTFPTKDEFFGWMDKLYGKLLIIEQELTFTNARLTRIEERVDRIERTLNLNPA